MVAHALLAHLNDPFCKPFTGCRGLSLTRKRTAGFLKNVPRRVKRRIARGPQGHHERFVLEGPRSEDSSWAARPASKQERYQAVVATDTESFDNFLPTDR